MRARRQFKRQFKLEVVRLVNERPVSVARAVPDLGVHANVLRRWPTEAAAAETKNPLRVQRVRCEMVETMRIELTTSALRTRRSPS